jgi:hypothetical protein
LEYELSGHTGFASTADLYTVSGTLRDSIDYLDDKIDITSGTLQYEIDTLTYLDLTDTDSTYSGHAGKYPVVNETEDALELRYFEWDPEGPLIPETAISGTYYVNFEGGRLLIGATGNKPDLVYLGPVAGLAFDASKVESCYAVFKIPNAWNDNTPIKLTINFMNADAQISTSECRWGLNYQSYEYGEVYGDKTTTVTGVYAPIPICDAATYFTQELYLAHDDSYNHIERGDVITFRFYRDGSVDTMTGDAILLALMFELTVGQNISGG